MNEQLIVEILFYCMACDGDIAIEEQAQLRQICLLETSIQTSELEQSIQTLCSNLDEFGANLRAFFKELSEAKLNEEEQIFVLESLIQMVLADGILQHQEVLYFSSVCRALGIKRELVEDNFPEHVEWLDVEGSLLEEIGSEIVITLQIED